MIYDALVNEPGLDLLLLCSRFLEVNLFFIRIVFIIFLVLGVNGVFVGVQEKFNSFGEDILTNCYAKLKDVDKLEEFIKQPGELKFDLDTAIVMCRQAGYYDQAAFLARRHNEHGLVVDILIEDLKKYAEALAYIVRLQPKDAYRNFMKYGTVLLEHCSSEATQLFIDYFTGNFRPKKDAVIVQEAPSQQP